MQIINKHGWGSIGFRLTKTLKLGLLGLVLASLAFTNSPQSVQGAPSTTMNFQARLLNSTGSIVADGNYHVEFKLYNAASGGSALWTETRSTGNLVTVKSGYLSVYLGSVNAFPGTIDWNEEHWLTMNIGGASGSPTWDGEMNPRIKLTAVPYAFQANVLAKSSGSDRGTLSFGSVTNNPQITLPDDSGEVCLDSGNCAYGTGDIVNGGQAGSITVGTNDNTSFYLETNNINRIEIQGDGDIAVDTNTLFVDAVNNRVGVGTATPDEALDVVGNATVVGRLAVGNNVSGTTNVNEALKVNHSFSAVGSCTGSCSGASLAVTVGDTTGTLIAAGLSTVVNTSASSITLPLAAGVLVGQNTAGAGSTITANYGVYVTGQTAGTEDFGVYIQGADTYALWVDSGATKLDGTLDVDGVSAFGNGALATPNINNVILARHTFSGSTNCTLVCAGVSGVITADNPAAATHVAGLYAQITSADTAFTLSNGYGLRIDSAVKGAASTFTNNYGIRVENQTAGNNDYGIYVGGADTYALWVDSGASRLDGTLTVQGNTDVEATGSFATMAGTTYTTAGSANNVALSTASLYRLDTSGAAQTLTGIAAGRNGQQLTLVNADASLGVTLSNLSGSSSAANQISTGTGTDLVIPAGGSVTLVYDSTSNLWRVVGSTAVSGGSANQALSNLTATSINQSLNPNADNTLDLGSSSNSWRSLYADTSVLTPNVDVATTGTLGIGNTTATAVSVCNSAACDTISVGSNADADTITVGDSTDTIGINGTTTITGTTSILGAATVNSTGTAATTIGNTTGVLSLTGGGASLIDFAEFDVSSTTGSITINDGGDAGQLLVESTNLDINSLDFVGLGGITTGAATALTLNSGTTGTINIGTDASAETINIGNTGAAVKTVNIGNSTQANLVTIGSTTGAAALTLQSGTGDVNITSQNDINIGTNAVAQDIVVGNTTGATSIALNSGSGGLNLNASNNQPTNINTGTSTGLVTIGGGSGTFSLQTTNIDISSAGAVSGVTDYAQSSGAFAFSGAGNFSVDSAAFDVTTAGAVSGVTTLSTSGIITAGALGTANTATLVCRNSSNQLAACNTTGTGAAFVHEGNSFGAAAILGTNDAFGLQLETGGTTRLTIDTSGNATLTGNLTVQGTGTSALAGALTVDGNTTLGNANTDTLTITGTAVTLPNNLNLDNDTLFIDAANNRVGIGNAAPTVALQITGDGIFSDRLQVGPTGDTIAQCSSLATLFTPTSCDVGLDVTNTADGTQSSFGSLSKLSTTAASSSSASQFGTYSALYLLGTQNYTAGNNAAVYAEAVSLTSGTTSNLMGMNAYVNNFTGTTAAATAVNAAVSSSSGSIGTAKGLNVASATGTITNNYGIYVADQTAGTNDYGVYIQGAQTTALWVDSGATNLDGVTTVGSGLTSGVALTVNNGTSTSNILNIQDNGTNVFSVADGGSVGIKTGANAPTADLTFGDGANRTINILTRTSAGAGNNLTVVAGAANGSNNAGGALNLQGGNAGTGNANGGGVVLTGGAGVGTGATGLVVIGTPTFQAATVQNFTGNGTITAANVNGNGTILISSNAAGYTATLGDPTITTAGRVVYVANSGAFDITLSVNGGGTGNTVTLKPATTATMLWNGADWTAAGASSSTDLQAAYNNTATSAGGAELVLNAPGGSADGLTIRNNATTPISGGVLEVQTAIGTNILSVNNNSIELVANGGAENSTTYATNWTTLGTSTISRTTTSGQYVTGTAGTSVAAGTTAGNGVRNNLATNPATGTTYMISFTAKLASATFTDMRVDYTPTGASTGTQCGTSNYTLSTTEWTRITCEVTTPGTAVTNADVLIYQVGAAGAARTFYIDNLSMTLADNSGGIPNNVQIGGGINGGAPTLFTLDRSSAPPVANSNTTYYGSMYYDTTTGRIQCYESDGWGACGSAPDNIITLTPEYTGAVLNGSGIGTMTADFCSNQVGVLEVNTSFCASGLSRQYYKWTSPQATDQTYSIYVSYKLPNTFKSFTDANTMKLTALTDNATNGSVTYEVLRSTGTAVSSCGSATNVTSGGANTWHTISFGGDETACGFTGGNYIIFKVNVTAKSNANVYVENLDFTYLNQ